MARCEAGGQEYEISHQYQNLGHIRQYRQSCFYAIRPQDGLDTFELKRWYTTTVGNHRFR